MLFYNYCLIHLHEINFINKNHNWNSIILSKIVIYY